jgi:hypothetical protein
MDVSAGDPRARVRPPSVGGAIVRLRRFQRKFSKLFELMSESLPRVHADVSELCERLDELQHANEGHPLTIALRATRTLETRFRGELERIRIHTQHILSLGREVTGSVNDIARTVQEVDVLSRRLGLIGLNAGVTAIRTGAEGRAFSVLTVELGVIKDSALRGAKRVRDATDVVRQCADDLLHIDAEVQARLDEVDAHAPERVDLVTTTILRQVDRLLSTLAASSSRSRAILDPICTIMNSIQRQDILRQGIDHVDLVLTELRDEYDLLVGHDPPHIGEYLRFQQKGGNLSASLLKSIDGELVKLCGDVDRQLEAIVTAAVVLADVRSELGEGNVRSFTSPFEALEETLSQLVQHASLLGTCEGIARRLDGAAHRVSEQLGELDTLARQLRMVNVFLRIEVARSDALSRGGTICQELETTFHSFVAFVAAAEASLKKARENVTKLEASARAACDLASGIEVLRLNVACHAEATQQAANNFVRELDTVVKAGHETAQHASDFSGRVRRFSASIDSQREVNHECTALSVEAEALLAEIGEDDAALDEAAQTKIEAIIDRFTIFSHKEIAQALQLGEAREGGSGGELTLF